MSNREFEYQEVHRFIRHLYEFRTKLFSFAIALNAILFSVLFQYAERLLDRIQVAIFGVVITIVFLLIESRSKMVRSRYIEYGRNLEKELGFKIFSEVDSALNQRLRTRHYFLILYGVMLLLWVVRIIVLMVT